MKLSARDIAEGEAERRAYYSPPVGIGCVMSAYVDLMQQLVRWTAWTESPLEALFLSTFVENGTVVEVEERVLLDQESRIRLLVNWPLERFRPDFIFVRRSRVRAEHLIVEIDGHDFHERTAEQAARDKRRDRQLARTSWRVYRFTGSEVFHDPEACLREVYEALS